MTDEIDLQVCLVLVVHKVNLDICLILMIHEIPLPFISGDSVETALNSSGDVFFTARQRSSIGRKRDKSGKNAAK